jgi:acyl-coenzyme A synthetase/AMP-(fatty) acid ligase
MKGYWDRPELTARAFVEDGEGRRFYRTGDRVSSEPAGLVLHGRRDRMLKLRGYRVQPEEIEACLVRHPDVLEAAALATGEPGFEQIAAAVAARADVSDDALRSHCSGLLPSYMVPARIARVPELPRTSRGKVDFGQVSAIVRGRA